MANTQGERTGLFRPGAVAMADGGDDRDGLHRIRRGHGVNHNSTGFVGLAIGLAVLVYMMIGWFSMVAGESEHGAYNRRVDASFRWGMSWFIFSEVMFFASFFGALFCARLITAPMLGDFDHKLLWPDFKAAWPHAGPAGVVEAFSQLGPSGCRPSIPRCC